MSSSASSSSKDDSYDMLAKLLIVFLIVHLLAVITLILMFSADHEVASNLVVPVSSVWCAGSTLHDRTCYFKNLCYSYKERDFVFVHGNESVISGIPDVSPRAPLVDLSGGVQSHGNTGLYFNLVDVPAAAVGRLNLTSTILPDSVQIFARFKPDNLMHVIHDDLLPLYMTLQELEYSGAPHYRLFFTDTHDEGPFWILYRLFRSKSFLNSHHPLLPSTIRQESRGDYNVDLICFANARVGGVSNTKWYQYGFDSFQGPVDKPQLTGDDIRAFGTWVRRGLEVAKYDIDKPRFSARVRQKTEYAVLFTRRNNRKILNEAELVLGLSRAFNLRILTVDLETQSLSEIIHLLHNCTLLIGMHGAELALSLFLPPHSILIELYPYGIPADNYTPYRSLTRISGMKLVYRAWQNTQAGNTQTHPEYADYYGGIEQLSAAEQQAVISELPIKQHKCCTHPAFLYRMYQDTYVDVPGLVRVVDEAFEERNRSSSAKKTDLLLPTDPRNVSCQVDAKSGKLYVEWQPPWNLVMLGGKDVQYEIRVQEEGTTTYQPFYAAKNHTEIVWSKPVTRLFAWILCWKDGMAGMMSKMPAYCSKL